jgi:hypothetical protein
MNDRKGNEKQVQTTGDPIPNKVEKRPSIWIFLSAFIGFIYLLNPTFGVLELIPDNMPLVGNLDEGAAAILVYQGIKEIIHSRKNK